MASSQTEKLELGIWARSDPFTMDEFNSAHRTLEAKLGRLGEFEILSITTSAAVNQIDIPLSGVDWEQFSFVYIDFDAYSPTTSNNVWLRLNGTSNTYTWYHYTDSEHSGAIGFCADGQVMKRLIFPVLNTPDRKVTAILFSDEYIFHGRSTNIKFTGLETLNLVLSDEELLIPAGAKIRMWGVK